MRVKLTGGRGVEGESHCVMAATSMLNGEGFHEYPKCVSKNITTLCVNLNDLACNDKNRQEILGDLPWEIIGTNPFMDENLSEGEANKIERERLAKILRWRRKWTIEKEHYAFGEKEPTKAKVHYMDLIHVEYSEHMSHIVRREYPFLIINEEMLEDCARDGVRLIREELIPMYTTAVKEADLYYEGVFLDSTRTSDDRRLACDSH